MKNIAERKQPKVDRDHLAEIIEATTDMVSICDPAGDFLYLNSAGRTLLGVGVSEDITNAAIADFIPNPADHPILTEGLSTAVRLGKWIGETVLLSRGGREIPVSQVILAHKTADGKLQMFSITMRDITLRKGAVEALQRSEALYRLVVEKTNDIVWTFDLSSMTYTFVSPSLQRILGYDVETIVKNLDVIFTPETKQRVLKAFGEFIESNANGDILVMEAEHRQKDGHLIWMEISASPLKDDFGAIAGFLGTTRDISERRRVEEEKAKLEGQLHQAQKMESMGSLAGGVAHDFNNMLGIIIGHAELALGQVDPALPLHAHLKEIHRAANRSADLTRQLLAFARKQTIAPKALDLNETVEGMFKMLRRLIGEDINLSWQPKANLWRIKVDPSQIDQILANLCVNSRDAIPGVGKMIIETGNRTFEADYCGAHAGFTPGEYVMLAVSDDGCGMDKKTQDHIFEPFFTTKEMGKGTGLGLATVYGIVRQNSGFINVYSEPGLGTKFTIYLPRHKGKADQMQQKESAEPLARGHETILLVEDEQAILELIMMMLTKLGYTVLTAGTPSGITHLAAEYVGKIHLLMTDVVMPGMNGRDLARNLLPCYPNLKHLFMSGYTADVIAHNGILDDGVNFIQKPFSIKELAFKVREALGYRM